MRLVQSRGRRLPFESFLIQHLFFPIIAVGNDVFHDLVFILSWLSHLLRIKEMAADEWWIVVIWIWFSVFIGTMKRCAVVSFGALLVEIDASGLWTTTGTIEFTCANTSVHYRILTINIIAHPSIFLFLNFGSLYLFLHFSLLVYQQLSLFFLSASQLTHESFIFTVDHLVLVVQ